VAEYSATASSTEIGANFLEKSNSDSQASISSEENTIKANSKNNLLIWRVFSFFIVFSIWELAGRADISIAFPPFSKVLVAFVEMIFSGEFFVAYADSLPPLLTGLFITIIGGVIIGISIGLVRSAEWFIMPLLIIFQTAPVSALIPMLTYIYGISDTSKIVAIVILGMPLVALNSYKGIQATNPSLLEMSKSFLASRLDTILFVILPSAQKMIFAGLRLGISGAFIGIVLAELLITPTGIGDLITYNRFIARYDKMFATIVSILAIAGLTLSLMRVFEDWLFPSEKNS
jgi:ABC-type nitrate/sulfonate/bicarbonate transport system permease component|tara:strand:+ start:1319 stop:2185 length:867 start_codon:yes stop_codon:yes gene_type:complete